MIQGILTGLLILGVAGVLFWTVYEWLGGSDDQDM